MSIPKLEVVTPSQVTAVLFGDHWQAIKAGSFEEKTEGYTFVIEASEPGGEQIVFVPGGELQGVRKA